VIPCSSTAGAAVAVPPAGPAVEWASAAMAVCSYFSGTLISPDWIFDLNSSSLALMSSTFPPVVE